MGTEKKNSKVVTQNACKLCAPLGASLVYKGIKEAMTILHGSQGCATYIRRYFIGHFREPVDIASSSFTENTAIYGGKDNLLTAIKTVAEQYKPKVIGIATTCLSETIGDDVKMFLSGMEKNEDSPEIIRVSTPSYQGTHMNGFHDSVLAAVEQMAISSEVHGDKINIFPGMISCEDIRMLKEVLDDFGIEYVLFPDYSETLDGGSWKEYHKIPKGGTPVDEIKKMGENKLSIQFGYVLARQKSAGKFLEENMNEPLFSMGFPIGIMETDYFLNLLENISGKKIPEKYQDQKERLIDAYIDGHKYIFEKKAVVYGEADFVISIVQFLTEIGIIPVFCATGEKNSYFKEKILEIIPDYYHYLVKVKDKADFEDIDNEAVASEADLVIGHSKGYKTARRLNIPLVRVGFPIQDRIGGQRKKHLLYEGTQELFDEIVNAVVQKKQDESPVGYMAM